MPHFPENFIRQVIFRLDFPIGIEDLGNNVRPTEFQRALLHVLPIAREKDQPGFEVKMTSEGPTVQSISKTTYHFLNEDETQKIGLDKNFMFTEVTKFSSYEHFRELVKLAFEALSASYSDLEINRLGLRYVNVIEPVSSDERWWTGLIEDSLIAPLAFYEGDSISRALTTAELLEDSRRIRVTTGLANPDYPGAIRRPEFLIDIDVYTQQAVTHENVLPMVDDFQIAAKREFMRCVKEDLKRLMEGDSNASS